MNGLFNSGVDGVLPHGSSAIDYFIGSEDLLSAHHELRVEDRDHSLHLPVEMLMSKVGRTADKPTQAESYEECIVWSETCLPRIMSMNILQMTLSIVSSPSLSIP